MSIIEAVKTDKYNLNNIDKDFLLSLLELSYNEGVVAGQKSIRVRLANLTHAIIEDEEKD